MLFQATHLALHIPCYYAWVLKTIRRLHILVIAASNMAQKEKCSRIQYNAEHYPLAEGSVIGATRNSPLLQLLCVVSLGTQGQKVGYVVDYVLVLALRMCNLNQESCFLHLCSMAKHF